ncbi:MAG: hypothetical protein ACE5J9_09355 [Methanosarcinales archaeon]
MEEVLLKELREIKEMIFEVRKLILVALDIEIEPVKELSKEEEELIDKIKAEYKTGKIFKTLNEI